MDKGGKGGKRQRKIFKKPVAVKKRAIKNPKKKGKRDKE